MKKTYTFENSNVLLALRQALSEGLRDAYDMDKIMYKRDESHKEDLETMEDLFKDVERSKEIENPFEKIAKISIDIDFND